MHRWEQKLVVALGLTVTGCGGSPTDIDVLGRRQQWFASDASCSETSPRSLPPTRVSDTLTASGARLSDQQWAWWARNVPGGWGGGPYYLYSTRGSRTMLLRDPTRSADALAALDTLVPTWARRDQNPPATIVVKEGRWDLAELYDWKYYLSSNFGTAKGAGITLIGVYDQRNAVLLGTESETTLPAMTDWLRGLGVPCQLVIIEITGPASLAGTGSASRRDAVSPL